MIDDNEIKFALLHVINMYGSAAAKRVEQLFRNETGHFKSGNFLITLSPGMQATKNSLPFGWTSLAQFWKDNPDYAPTGIHIQNENASALAEASGEKSFMIFPSIEASMMSVAEKIKINGGDAGTWFDNNPDDQKKYDGELDKIIPRFCNALSHT